MNPNQRRPEESEKDFKERRRRENKAAKGRVARMLWPATKGTYVRAKHGPLT